MRAVFLLLPLRLHLFLLLLIFNSRYFLSVCLILRGLKVKVSLLLVIKVFHTYIVTEQCILCTLLCGFSLRNSTLLSQLSSKDTDTETRGWKYRRREQRRLELNWLHNSSLHQQVILSSFEQRDLTRSLHPVSKSKSVIWFRSFFSPVSFISPLFQTHLLLNNALRGGSLDFRDTVLSFFTRFNVVLQQKGVFGFSEKKTFIAFIAAFRLTHR